MKYKAPNFALENGILVRVTLAIFAAISSAILSAILWRVNCRRFRSDLNAGSLQAAKSRLKSQQKSPLNRQCKRALRTSVDLRRRDGPFTPAIFAAISNRPCKLLESPLN